jgi:carbonic anhydrase/acetyltransferase-like protein (isoleucine patch superfamily)
MFDPFVFHPELVDPTAFLAVGARLIGDVTIGAESSVWFNAVIRGDREAIRIGRRTNVQDMCVLHADPGTSCTLGDRVSVGHAAIVHGATVADDVLIGMRAVIMNRARIGAGSIIGVGAVVTEDTEIPPGSIVIGVPGKIKRAAEERDRKSIRHAADYYVKLAKQYRSEG